MDQLHWLPTHNALGEAITAARALPDALARLTATARLAGYRRDFTATNRLDRLLTGCLKERPDSAPELGLTPLRVALLASHTVDHLVPGLRIGGLGRRLLLDVEVAPYGQYRQMLLDDQSPLKAFRPQVVVFMLDAADSPVEVALSAAPAEVEAAIAGRVDELRGLWRRARDRFNARVIQQTLLPTELAVLGHFDGLVPGSPAAVLERLNRAIRDAAREEGVLLLDLASKPCVSAIRAGAIRCVGIRPSSWSAWPWRRSTATCWRGFWPRRPAFLRKCLVLDLDNTLWGGVVGDDGVEGIQLGQGHPTGEAFLAFQRYIAKLGSRGVILAVCSQKRPSHCRRGFRRASRDGAQAVRHRCLRCQLGR